MLRLAYKNDKLQRLPVIERLDEAAPRAGFFEDAQYEAVRSKLPADLQVVAAIAHTYGWRAKSEILPLERRQLDLEHGTLRLDPGATKNDEPRVSSTSPPSSRRCWRPARARGRPPAEARQDHPVSFPRLRGRRAGRPWRDFCGTWKTACKNAGAPGRIPHDFRRTAVRNHERAVVSRSVAMKITGHKTESVYRRYAIVSDADLQDAVRKLTGTFSGTSSPVKIETRSTSS